MPALERWWIIWRADSQDKLSGTIVEAQSRPPLPQDARSIEGPLPTKAAAQKEVKRIEGAKPVTGGGPLNPVIVAGSAAGITDPLGLFAIGHWIGKLVSGLTDVHMWISLGWMALGISLFLAGLALLLKLPQRGAAIGARLAAA